MRAAKNASYLGLFLVAAVCFYGAYAVYNAAEDVELIKIKPYDFSVEQSALKDLTIGEVDIVRMSAGMLGISFDEMRALFLKDHRTEEQNRQGRLPLTDFIAERTHGHVIVTDGPAWEKFLASVAAGDGKEERGSEQSGIFSLFFTPDEEPLSQLRDSLRLGETNWIRQASNGSWFEVYRLPKGELTGVESGPHDSALQWAVPDRFLHPYRPWTRWFVVAGLVALFAMPVVHFAGFLNRQGVVARPDFRNPDKRVARAWTWATLVLLGVCIAPAALGADMMKGGFAVAVIAGFGAAIGAVVVLVFARRAAQLDRMVNGRDLIAHWTFSEEEWTRFSAGEHARDKDRTKMLLALLAAFFVVFGLVILFAGGEGGGVTFAVMMVVLVGIAGFAFIAVRGRARRALTAPREVYLSPTCAYVGGTLHSWSLLFARLEQVHFVEGEHPEIEITYSYPGRYRRQSWTFRIPVPKGKEDEGARAVRELSTGARRA